MLIGARAPIVCPIHGGPPTHSGPTRAEIAAVLHIFGKVSRFMVLGAPGKETLNFDLMVRFADPAVAAHVCQLLKSHKLVVRRPRPYVLAI